MSTPEERAQLTREYLAEQGIGTAPARRITRRPPAFGLSDIIKDYPMAESTTQMVSIVLSEQQLNATRSVEKLTELAFQKLMETAQDKHPDKTIVPVEVVPLKSNMGDTVTITLRYDVSDEKPKPKATPLPPRSVRDVNQLVRQVQERSRQSTTHPSVPATHTQ